MWEIQSPKSLAGKMSHIQLKLLPMHRSDSNPCISTWTKIALYKISIFCKAIEM